jgi:hypothetical protein
MAGMSKFVQHLAVDLRAFLGQGRVWAVLAVGILLFALAGPFGSFGVLGFPMRLAMWAVVGLTAFLAGVLGFFGTLALLPRHALQGWVAALVASVPVTLTALMVDNLFVAVPVTLERAVTDWLHLTPFVLALCWLLSQTPAARQSREALAVPAAPPLLDRLRPGLGRQLVSLTARDHYVEVVTEAGRDLILYRFADAMAQLQSEGAQIHRSHWVAARAVVGRERQGGKLWVILRDGSRLPVSRSYAQGLGPLLGAGYPSNLGSDLGQKDRTG